jgi:hypothetical protein
MPGGSMAWAAVHQGSHATCITCVQNAKWVGALDKTAERLEGGHSLQVYRYLLGITAR